MLFAYGTLGPADEAEAKRLGWRADAVRGRLFDPGPYPVLVGWDDPDAGWVEGYVRPVDRPELEQVLDPYEGVDEGLFRRVELRTRAGLVAWTYVFPHPVPEGARGPLTRWVGLRVDPASIDWGTHTEERCDMATETAAPGRDASRPTTQPTTVGRYLIDRLQALGVEHIFGIPGDYILNLYKMLDDSPITVVGMTREDNAGFAADAYARVRGLGCMAVTYCVGGLSACNSIAGAYAEKSPVVVLTGSPGLSERERNPLLHHKVKDFDTQYQVFKQFTAAGTVLNDPLTAFSEIDRVLGAALRYKRPVYIEVPRDMVNARQVVPHPAPGPLPPSDPDALREALDEAEAMLRNASRPMILADVEIHRFGLQEELIRFAEEANLPIATTLLGKSVISEEHPLFAGVYEGAMGREEVTDYVERADCLLMLGCFLTDINLGIFTANLDPARCIDATSEDLRIRHHHYREVRLDDFLRGLRDRGLQLDPPAPPSRPTPVQPWSARAGEAMTSARLFSRLNQLVDEHYMVIADIGDSLFGSADLRISRSTEFLSPAYYTSMGFAVPASVGAGIANRDLRPLVIVGDGAFQMTGMELATVVRNGLAPIVVVLNNKGYTTERFILDGPFNDLLNWSYHRIPDLLGSGIGLEVRTEDELDAALSRAVANTDSFSLINVHLDPMDRSPALERLAERLAGRV
ncbi:thiamine pyrophosphate-binding protein [Tautonia sociabilis]|uniref:thiamine pyrophosphate-binding protein n=1 Tax=Tautonia sociabilis TaxID=2080755 RepID=UPI0013156A4C|nr:thiamine pyrophosphate-binding protein [Tautonia sociabilis]